MRYFLVREMPLVSPVQLLGAPRFFQWVLRRAGLSLVRGTGMNDRIWLLTTRWPSTTNSGRWGRGGVSGPPDCADLGKRLWPLTAVGERSL